MNIRHILVVLGLGLSTSAFAADPGFYIGGGVGQARYSGDLVGQMDEAFAPSTRYFLSSADMVDGSDSAWKLFAGYRFGNGFGLELSHVDLGTALSQYHVNALSILQPAPEYLVDGRYDAKAWGLSGFYEWEFSPAFAASVRAGYFNASLDYFQSNSTVYEYPDQSHSGDKAVPGFGLGLNWGITPSVDLRLDYDRYQGIGKRFAFEAEDTNGRLDIGVVSLNLAYRFGR